MSFKGKSNPILSKSNGCGFILGFSSFFFQHPPHVRPTSLASPTNRGIQKVAGGLSNRRAFQSQQNINKLNNYSKKTKAGGWGGRQLLCDGRRSDDSNRGAIESLQKVSKVAGGLRRRQPPP